MEYKGLTLDKFQEDSIRAIEQNKSVVVSAPTGSGKTLIADYIIGRDLKRGVKVIYTAPIKALSNQKYKEFTTDYGKENVGLLTGDIVKNPDAPILIMTTEIYRNMVLIDDPFLKDISYVVFDEIHYINDVERGYVWEESIIFSKPNVRFLCLSATIPNADEFARWIRAIKKHPVVVIHHDVRIVPLQKKFFDSELGITTLKKIRDIKDIPSYEYLQGRTKRRSPRVKPPDHVDLIKQIKDKTPCFFFNFSRKGCQDNALQLAKKNLFGFDPKISTFVRRKLEGLPKEINNLKSTKLLRETLPRGVGFHHAGLLPILKDIVEELFGEGLIKVLYTTETFAVGINMPAKTVCFQALRKFDGVNFRFLNSKEYFQIAGRAGRRGIDKEGFVYSMVDRRDFDYRLLDRMTSRDVDPIKSQFKLSVNTVLNLIKQHDEKEINEILCKNFDAFQKYGSAFDRVKKQKTFFTFERLKKRLTKMGYVKNNTLTPKGTFAAKIYADEILTGELFATRFYEDLDEFQMFMLIASLAYESREKTKFYQLFPSKKIRELQKLLSRNSFLEKRKQFRELKNLTALVDPCYNSKSIFEVMKNTNLLEGDLIRFFRQILDRIGQVRNATDDDQLKGMLGNIQTRILDSMENIDVV